MFKRILLGLTCSEQNFITKAGSQRHASKHRVIVVNPDTSPRGCGIEGETDSFDLGEAAGFYVDATEAKWAKHYRMYSYIVEELVPLISAKFPVDDTKRSIFGHSMGGHGIDPIDYYTIIIATLQFRRSRHRPPQPKHLRFNISICGALRCFKRAVGQKGFQRISWR